MLKPERTSPGADPAEEVMKARRLLDRTFTAECLPHLRLLVEEYAAGAGLNRDRRADLVLAVDEIAANAIEHAGGRGQLVLQRRDGEFECLISDEGPGFSEDLVPELLPGLDATSGRGLWLSRLLTDRMSVSGGETGAVVTLVMKLF